MGWSAPSLPQPIQSRGFPFSLDGPSRAVGSGGPAQPIHTRKLLVPAPKPIKGSVQAQRVPDRRLRDPSSDTISAQLRPCLLQLCFSRSLLLPFLISQARSTGSASCLFLGICSRAQTRERRCRWAVEPSRPDGFSSGATAHSTSYFLHFPLNKINS
jgi:hypothetical protein